MKPAFAVLEDSYLNCHFNPQVPSNYEMDPEDFFVRKYPYEKLTEKEDGFTKWNGKVALLYLGKWLLEDATLLWNSDYNDEYFRAQIVCHTESNASTFVAYPIDPIMTEKDINGATIIEPNASNDGWLFAHATKSEHIDRIWTASTAMSSIFDNVMEDKLQQTLAAIVNENETNQQRGYYSHWARLQSFKKDCTAYCVRFEKLLYLGQHKQQSGLNLRDMLLLCIKHVKGEWEKAKKFDGVSGDINPIITALEADHDFETRWEQEARHKREAAARAAAETETETENE